MLKALPASFLGGAIERNSSVPAHSQIRNRILVALQSGALKVGDLLPSEIDISAQLGVSRMTANKAIIGLVSEGWLIRERGRGTFVAERPQVAITRCVVFTKQVASAGARDDYYYGALYWAIREYFQKLDLRVDVSPITSKLCEDFGPVDDAVFIALNPDHASALALSQLGRLGKSVAIVGSSWEGGHVDTVDSDNLLGAALAVNHLVDLGHRRIAFLGASIEDSNTVDRLRAFRVAIKARGLDVREEDIIMDSSTQCLSAENRCHLAKRLLAPEGVTAVFAAGANLAMQLLGIAQCEGLAVPKALSIVAYDDPSFLAMTNPPMTTVLQPLQAMATRACEIVMENRALSRSLFEQIVLDPSLIIRSSTAQCQLCNATKECLS